MIGIGGHVTARFEAELARRLAGPQRHRLLQGYPMLPLMGPALEGPDPERFPLDAGRRLIAGVLPHPFCNPAVAGCGFCTFPHESYRGAEARALARSVAAEVAGRVARVPGLRGRRVDALYVGGGTANLTPPDVLAELLAAIGESFDLSRAEVSLEGAPVHFLARGSAHLRLLAALPVRTARISMGVQTFDRAWLGRMGRLAFGDRETIGRVLAEARALGLATSVDLLANLPGQPREAMLEDVRTAAALGADQVCVYHLVLHEGLGTEWSRDRALLAARPDNAAALGNWLAVREELLALGFVPATLTNFERRAVHEGPRRFVYEAMSYEADRTDAVGFGPSAISTFTSGDRALKLVNAAGSRDYSAMVAGGGRAEALRFDYGPEDRRLLHVTRGLARLALENAPYRAAFGSDPAADFEPAFEAARRAGLVTLDGDAIRLTPRGVFFADSVAGLVAWPRTLEIRRRRADRGIEAPLGPGEAAPQFMG